MQEVCSYGDHYIAYEDLKMSIEAKIVAGAGREFKALKAKQVHSHRIDIFLFRGANKFSRVFDCLG